MDTAHGAIRDHFLEMRTRLREALAGLSPAQIEERTLDGWSVKDHLFHIAAWDRLRALEVRRISAGHESAWRMTEEQEAGLNAILHGLQRDLGLDQASWEFEDSHQRLLDALASATGRGLDPALYGEAALWSTHEAQHTDWIVRWRTERGH